MKKSAKKQIHFVIQGKGGCGKSLLALIIGMYFKINKKNVFDLDKYQKEYYKNAIFILYIKGII